MWYTLKTDVLKALFSTIMSDIIQAVILAKSVVTKCNRRMDENGFASPPPHLGKFADISYLVEN